MSRNKPNYHNIFRDIIEKKFPEKTSACERLLSKRELSIIDIMAINNRIFGSDKATEVFNQQHKSYSESDIRQILNHQKKHQLNNSQLAQHFKLSRTTVTRWKKIY